MRLRSALLAAPLLAAIACADDAPPTASAGPAASRSLAGAPTCDTDAVVGSITSLYPPPDRGATLGRFQRARVSLQRGDVEQAWPELLWLAEDALTRAAAGTLRDPPGALTATEGAVLLVDRLYVCGGREPVGDVLDDVLDGGVDVAFTVVRPGEPTSLVVPSANFGLKDTEGGFFDEAALLVIERVPDSPPFVPGTFSEYPPRYKVYVLPASAQANFGRVPGGDDPTILVLICPADPHPDLDDLTILRVPDDFPTTDAQLLDAEHMPDPDVTCSDVPPYPGASSAAQGLGTRVFGALRRAGAAAFGWLAPEPLYAVDGGIGGRTRLLSQFVAVGRESAPTPGEDVIVVNDINVLDNVALQSENNRQFARNLVSFTGSGPRAAGTTVVYDRSHASLCLSTGFCDDADLAELDEVLTDAGFTVERRDASFSYASLDPGVKTIILFNPTTSFTATEVADLRGFAADGGRIVFLGEHLAFYGQAGLDVENALLAGLGAQLTNEGATIDCAFATYPVLPATSLRAHQTTAGLTGLTVACMSRIVPGPDDYAFLYDSSNEIVVGGAAKIGTPVVTDVAAARLRGGIAPNARRGGAAVTTPTLDPSGRPLAPRR